MEALIVAIVFSVPLSAIVGSYWVKVKRLELESGAKDVEPRLRALEAENRELRQRVEVLETIATSDSPARTRVRVDASPRAPEGHELEVTPEAAQRSQRAG
jgi:hypothetical protein